MCGHRRAQSAPPPPPQPPPARARPSNRARLPPSPRTTLAPALSHQVGVRVLVHHVVDGGLLLELVRVEPLLRARAARAQVAQLGQGRRAPLGGARAFGAALHGEVEGEGVGRGLRPRRSLTAAEMAPRLLCLGIEGSANKVGVGIVADDGAVLANPRKT